MTKPVKPKPPPKPALKQTPQADPVLKAGQKIGAHGKPVPLSEHERKFKEWTKAQCIAHLKDLAKAHPDMFISRNWFRANSEISDATWNRHFGTFQEFKRSAGVDLSRWAHRMEKNIARHAGHDDIHAFNHQKLAYQGLWERPDNGRRFKSLIALSDIHDKQCDPFYRRIAIDTIERLQPEIVVINGDLFDLPEFSKYTQDPREWDVTGRIRFALDFIRDIREAAPDCQIDLIEGNHEFRLFRHLAEATPALKSVLADLHGFDIPKLLGINEFEVNFVGVADLKAWTERDIKKELSRNWKTYWDSVMACHFPDAKKFHMPGFGGHHHKHIVWPFRSPHYGACEFHQMGAGHYRSAE